MRVMLDSDVLSYAVVAKPDAKEDMVRWQAARAVVLGLETVHVSAITWFELHRYQRKDGSTLATELQRIAKAVLVEPVDVAVAQLGAELLAHARTKQKLCKRCLASIDSKACKECGRSVAHNLKLNDALVVAHADQFGFDRLYSFDGGMHELGTFARDTLTVCDPPGDGPLWDHRPGQ